MAVADEHAEAAVEKSVQEVVEEYEELFKDRYTEKDKDYTLHLNRPCPKPPCIENWFVRPKRNFDWSQRGGGRGNRGGRVMYPGRRDDRDRSHPYQNDNYHRRNEQGGRGNYRDNRDGQNRGGYNRGYNQRRHNDNQYHNQGGRYQNHGHTYNY